MMRLIMAVATGLYTGYLPIAPGTFGSAIAIPLHYFLIRLSLPAYSAALVAVFIIGVFAAGSAEKILDRADPGVVVIDEVAGMLITLIGAPNNPWIWLLGFVLFRIFDILKPFPIGFIDRRLHGGLGIMLDDVAAGLYALATLQLFCLFWLKQ